MSKPARKKITKLGWGVKWDKEKIDFFVTKRAARHEMACWASYDSVLFRCKLEETVK